MKGKKKILACLALPFAVGLLFWWHWASQTVLRIRDYQTEGIDMPAIKKRETTAWIKAIPLKVERNEPI